MKQSQRDKEGTTTHGTLPSRSLYIGLLRKVIGQITFFITVLIILPSSPPKKRPLVLEDAPDGPRLAAARLPQQESGASIVRINLKTGDYDYVAISEERLIRQKYNYNFPLHSIDYCLKKFKIPT